MKLVYVSGNRFDALAGKGMQALVEIGEDGSYQVIGPPSRPPKHRWGGQNIQNVEWLLARVDREHLAKCAKAARTARGGVRL